MYLKQLHISNFKNFTEARIGFSEKINCLLGNNGTGKTNLLDAIYYLSYCKSYFNISDSLSVKHGEEYFSIHGTFSKNGDRDDKVSCLLKTGQRKKFSLNSKEYERLSEHIGTIPLVMISPYDRDLINEGSDVRRKFIDAVISQFDKLYLEELILYNRALQQRNSLLKKAAETGRLDTSLIEILDDQIVPLAKNIFEKRNNFLSQLKPLVQQYFEKIAEGREKIDIAYDSQLRDGNIAQLLKESLSNDRRLRYTTMGIHKDDITFLIDQFPIKKYGSQGQQKSFVVALRLAQFEYTRKIKGFKPLLLLDDIFDKLDNQRVEQLIALVGEDTFGQVFITDTQWERIAHIFRLFDINHSIFNIDDGKAEAQKIKDNSGESK